MSQTWNEVLPAITTALADDLSIGHPRLARRSVRSEPIQAVLA